jgi:hypothetical protein
LRPQTAALEAISGRSKGPQIHAPSQQNQWAPPGSSPAAMAYHTLSRLPCPWLSELQTKVRFPGSPSYSHVDVLSPSAFATAPSVWPKARG